MGVSTVDKMNFDQATVSSEFTPLSSDTELYNFGYAPVEVIQKFQDYCMKYTSLTEALLEILERESLLKRKYTFIAAPVMYQMLAKPTSNDTSYLLSATVDALRKFTRRGRYDSVSNAIEELLLSPTAMPASCHDKATWTEGNVNTNFTELNRSEQTVLEQIADALLHRLSTIVPQPKKRKAATKIQKLSGNQNTTQTNPKKRKSDENIKLAPVKRGKLSEPNIVSNRRQGFKSSQVCTKFLNSHLRPKPADRSTKPNRVQNSVDASIALPLKNFVVDRCTQSKERTKPTEFATDCRSPMKKDFFLGVLQLLPSLNSVD